MLLDGHALSCPMHCLRLCYAADGVHQLHKHLRASSAAALQQATCMQAWGLHRYACKGDLSKGIIFAVFLVLCDRQVRGNASVTG